MLGAPRLSLVVDTADILGEWDPVGIQASAGLVESWTGTHATFLPGSVKPVHVPHAWNGHAAVQSQEVGGVSAYLSTSMLPAVALPYSVVAAWLWPQDLTEVNTIVQGILGISTAGAIETLLGGGAGAEVPIETSGMKAGELVVGVATATLAATTLTIGGGRPSRSTGGGPGLPAPISTLVALAHTITGDRLNGELLYLGVVGDELSQVEADAIIRVTEESFAESDEARVHMGYTGIVV